MWVPKKRAKIHNKFIISVSIQAVSSYKVGNVRLQYIPTAYIQFIEPELSSRRAFPFAADWHRQVWARPTNSPTCERQEGGQCGHLHYQLSCPFSWTRVRCAAGLVMRSQKRK